MNTNLRDKKLKVYKLFFVLSFIPLIISSTWSVDMLHDGSFFVPAAAMSKGELLYVDVYSLFGHLNSWILFPLLKSVGIFLILSRVVGAIFMFITSLLLNSILQNYLSKRVSIGVSVMWTFTNSAWVVFKPNDSGFVFYSTNYCVLLFLTSIFLAIMQSKRIYINYFLIFLSSFTLALVVICRIEFVLSWIIVTFTLLFFNKNRKVKFTWVISGLSVFASYTVYLEITNSLSGYIKYISYFFPIHSRMNSTNLLLISSYVPHFIILISAGSFLLLYILFRKLSIPSIVFTALVLVALLLVLSNLSLRSMEYQFYNIQVYAWLNLIVRSIPQFYIGFIIVLPLYLILKHIKYIYIDVKSSNVISINPQLIILPILITTYPYLHNLTFGYIHPFLPLYFIFCASIISKISSDVKLLNISLTTEKIAVFFATVGLIMFFQNFYTPRYHYDEKILFGMSESSLYKKIQIDKKFSDAAQAILVDKEYLYSCSSWLQVINNTGYLGYKKLDDGTSFEKTWCALPLE